MAAEKTMTVARFAALVGAHGADPERWPAAERDAARGHLGATPPAEHLLAREARLDGLLETVPAPPPSSMLMGELLAAAPGPRRRLGAFLPLFAVWRPATALALAAVLGLAVGLYGPRRLEALALDVDMVAFAFTEADDEDGEGAAP